LVFIIINKDHKS